MKDNFNPTAEYFGTIRKKKQTLFSVLVIAIVIALVFTVLQPFKYSSDAKVLVIQNYGSNIDPYAASKSSEFVGSILTRVTKSESFYNEVMSSDFKIDQAYFPEDSRKRAELWSETLETRVIKDSGVITLSVYHTDKYQADQIMRAALSVIAAKHQLYHGMGNKISIKVIDQPISSNWPVRPNILTNLTMALLFGFLFGLVYIYLFPESKYDLNLIAKSSKKHIGPNFVGNISEDISNEDMEKMIRERLGEVSPEYASQNVYAKEFELQGDISNVIR